MTFVIKRNGNKENVRFDKITERINKLINPVELHNINLPWLNLSKEVEYLDPVLVAQKVVTSIYSGITTEKLDIESADICVSLSTTHPLYNNLGGRILVSNLHKKTLNNFSSKMLLLKDQLDSKWLDWVISNADELDNIINYNLDYIYDYFGFKTLEKSYLLKINHQTIERPQDTLLRTAVTLQLGNINMIKKTYHFLSMGYYTHASPTLYNAGTKYMQLASCFLGSMNDDLTSIAKAWNSCAQISKRAGGIGLHVSNIRSKNSLIKGTGGLSNGIIPFLKVFNEISRWVDQGGRRPGSIAIYLEPHHSDIFDFLDLRKNFGSETERTRDLFLALWISDFFMTQVDSDGDWYLMSADECPGLQDVYGQDYNNLYMKYVNEGKYRKKVKAREIWTCILESQIETGMPYITYKDSVNNKSNQKNIGTIKSSNLCVHEDTKILTEKGYQVIKTLENQHINIWNGFEWSKVLIKKTGSNKDLIRVNLSNGAYLDCTPQHKFYINNNQQVCASDLKFGDELIKYELPKNRYGFNPLNQKENLLNIKLMIQMTGLNSKIIDNKIVVFLEPEHSIESLLYIRLMLHSYGIESKIIDNMLISCESDECIKVISINDSYKNVDTYCFNEPLRHMGMFNGILTGQCNEIVEYSDDKEYAVCNLASIALKSFVEPFNFMNKEFIIYTKPDCKYCNYSKNFLINNNAQYIEIKYNDNTFNELVNIIKNENFTYPQIFIKDIHIGGWSELYQYTAGTFNWDKLYETAYLATINLNQVIDINYYPIPETKLSNIKHRPVGLGIQGLADVLVLLRTPFDSNNALLLNSRIMETIYVASITASIEISKSRYNDMKTLIESNDFYPEYYDNEFKASNDHLNKIYHLIKPNKCELDKDPNSTTIGAYSSFDGSPFSKGLFQFDMWNSTQPNNIVEPYFKHKWNELRKDIKKYGIRNSLLTALMPTASTSQILNNNECFEFFTSNIYTRKTLAGNFVLVNKYLVDDLIKINIWNKENKDIIIASNGSIQSNNNIPNEFKKLYKTMWELGQIWVLKGAVARCPYVDQTQSMNIYMAEPDFQRLSSCHFWSWKNGLKTGMYYLRTKPAVDAIKFTIDPNLIKKIDNQESNTCDSCSA